jgi:hypothetical protein
MVFSIVNYMGFKHKVFEGWKNGFALLGSMGCAGAFFTLIYDTYSSSINALYIIFGITVVLITARLGFIKFHSNFKKKNS